MLSRTSMPLLAGALCAGALLAPAQADALSLSPELMLASGDISLSDPLDHFEVPVERQEDDAEGEVEEEDGGGRRRRERRQVIKIVQEKPFIKFGRVEIAPTVGLVNDDPFLRRILFGATIGYHINDIFAIEGIVAYAPNLGDFDRKALFNLLFNNSEVVPDLSRLMFVGGLAGALSPIYGKFEMGRRVVHYDIYLLVGAGVMVTQDDEEVIQSTDESYVEQAHFMVQYGFGFRITTNQFMALRLEGRWYSHLEQVSREDLTIEMRSDFSIQLGLSFFLPTSPRLAQEEEE